MGKGGSRSGQGGGADAGDGRAPAAPRPGLLDRLTWLVLAAFLVLLLVGHG